MYMVILQKLDGLWITYIRLIKYLEVLGTIAGVAIEEGIQYFKENVVNWLDKSFDDFIKWISREWGELVNA